MAGIAGAWGLPGLRAAETAGHRIVFKGGPYDYFVLPQGRIIDSANARDPDNTPDVGQLRAGLLMGKITATGLYGASVVGVTQGAYTSGGTSLTVTVAQAVEIVRRFGTSGTLNVVGPPAAAGTVAVTSMTYSAVNTTTGVITCTSLGVNKIAGCLVMPQDGSGSPITLIRDGFPLQVTDLYGVNLAGGAPFPAVPIGGTVISTQIINYPADTSLQAWLKGQLSSVSGGKFVFDDQY